MTCSRCEAWMLLGLSNTCPTCDAAELKKREEVMASDDYDLHRMFIDRNCVGIPVRKWIDILTAIQADIANAKELCGRDGLGCLSCRDCYGDDHERMYRNCGQCPMDALSAIREAINGSV